MLLLQVSSPSREDCQRHYAGEVGLGNQYKRLNGLYAVMLPAYMHAIRDIEMPQFLKTALVVRVKGFALNYLIFVVISCVDDAFCIFVV